MILLVDNYDSFTHNLFQGMAGLGAVVRVVRNDAVSVEEVASGAPAGVVIGPGPGRPEAAGACLDLLAALPDSVPVLGVCLGHQALVVQEGGRVEAAGDLMHGRASVVHHDGEGLLSDLPSPFRAGRYHSLAAVRSLLPQTLALTAWTEEGEVMGVRHVSHPRFGLQFHPESVLTPQGSRIFARFLALAGEAVPER